MSQPAIGRELSRAVVRLDSIGSAVELEQSVSLANVDLRDAFLPIGVRLALSGFLLLRGGQGPLIGRKRLVLRASVELCVCQPSQVHRRGVVFYCLTRNGNSVHPVARLHGRVICGCARFGGGLASARSRLWLRQPDEEKRQQNCHNHRNRPAHSLGTAFAQDDNTSARLEGAVARGSRKSTCIPRMVPIDVPQRFHNRHTPNTLNSIGISLRKYPLSNACKGR